MKSETGDNLRTAIPKSMIEETLEKLHRGHRGVYKMTMRAKETVFWPGFYADIK